MSTCAFLTHRLTVAAAAAWALLAVGVPSAAAAPATDDQGYVDSTARCAPPDTAVAFGSTESSRVAICKTSAGQYEYRGVRVSDGAKLIVPASRSSDGAYLAEADGITYKVTANSLVVTAGNQVIRQEPMADYHELQKSKTPAAPPTPAPLPAAPKPTTSPTAPLPPPLPAEVGGKRR